MSIAALLLICTTVLIIISQFGSRLAARNAFVWWTTALFIIVASIEPEFLRPLTNVLGIQLISNFVLASLIMFLFLQVLELATETTHQSRKMRYFVASMAADDYLRKKERDDQEDSEKLKVLVVLPCFNEEEALDDTIDQIEGLQAECSQSGKFELNVCFVNDGSQDDSAKILAKRCFESFVSHRVNIGVAGVLLTGFEIGKRLRVDYVVQCDSDGQHPIHAIPQLVSYASRENLDLLVGSRFDPVNSAGNEAEKSTTMARMAGIHIIRSMLRVFGSQASIFDPTSGFRVYSKKCQATLFKNMPDEYPEPESVAILSLKNCRIGEFPVTMMPRTTGVSSINGLKTLRFMVKVLSALLGLRLRSLLSARPSNI